MVGQSHEERPFRIAGFSLGASAWLAAVALGVAATALRRPTGVLHPNLWAEDGAIFLRGAYLDPVYESVFHAYNGYLHLLPRIWAELTTLLPASSLALSYSLFSLVMAPLCYSLILSPRLRWLIPSDTARAVGFVALVLLPGTGEVLGTLTNVLWPIGIALALYSFCSAPKTRRGRTGELVAIGALGLSGAGCLLVLPAFAMRWWRERQTHNAVVLGLVGVCCAVQVVVLQFSERAQKTGLHLKPRAFVHAILLRVWGTGTLGERSLPSLQKHSLPLIAVALFAAALVVTLLALNTTPRIFRVQWLITFALATGATAWAHNGDLHPLAYGVGGARYFMLPIALCVIAVLAASGDRVWRRTTVRVGVLAPIAAFFAFAVFRDLALPELPQTQWAKTAACIKKHQVCRVVVNPQDFSFDLAPVPGVR